MNTVMSSDELVKHLTQNQDLTLDDLKDGFTLCEYSPMFPLSGALIGRTYVFTFNDDKMYVSEGVFGKNQFEVSNPFQVLFAAITHTTIQANIKDQNTQETVILEINHHFIRK